MHVDDQTQIEWLIEDAISDLLAYSNTHEDAPGPDRWADMFRDALADRMEAEGDRTGT